MFLKNAWYVAAWGEEIGNTLQQVVVLGEKICVYRNSEGEVEYFEEPLEVPEAGHVLICCSRPKGRVVLDL